MKTIPLVLAALTLAAAFGGGSAQAAFVNARPTTPLRCDSPEARALGAKAWFGQFHGSRELERGWGRKESTFEQLCFASEVDCRNWLYNMQSTYRDRVWSAFCKKGTGN